MRALILACLPLVASAGETPCPLTLAAEAVTVRAPADWHGSAPSFTRLTHGGIMRGHPDSMGYLVPLATKTRGAKTAIIFQFAPGEERWLWCAYGPLHLSKRLDDAAGNCVLHYTKSKLDGITEMHATCATDPDSSHLAKPAPPLSR